MQNRFMILHTNDIKRVKHCQLKIYLFEKTPKHYLHPIHMQYLSTILVLWYKNFRVNAFSRYRKYVDTARFLKGVRHSIK